MEILVTGASGMLGRAICSELEKINSGVCLHSPSREELDLLDINSVNNYMESIEFDLIIHCAALVGGIGANVERPFDFLNVNLRIDSNIMTIAYNKNVSGFMYMASSCMYPTKTNQPMSESQILTGELEHTNEGYALAKIVGLKTVEVASKTLNWHAFILSNMYGPGDNFDIHSGHLISSAISKVGEAKENDKSEVKMWGSGSARREFTFVYDVAEYLVSVISDLSHLPTVLNLGTGEDYSVIDYYKIVCEEMGFYGEINADLEKPEGMQRKLLDVSLAKQFGWNPRTNIRSGIRASVLDYEDRLNRAESV